MRRLVLSVFQYLKCHATNLWDLCRPFEVHLHELNPSCTVTKAHGLSALTSFMCKTSRMWAEKAPSSTNQQRKYGSFEAAAWWHLAHGERQESESQEKWRRLSQMVANYLAEVGSWCQKCAWILHCVNRNSALICVTWKDTALYVLSL